MNPIEPRLLGVEVVADLPVLWATFQRMDLLVILDRHFPAPLHWKGPLTPGEVLPLWLLFLVSQGDHCLNHVQPWADQHQRTLSALLGKPVVPTDVHDDRLADGPDRLADADRFRVLERDLNQQTIRAYQLPTEMVRIDTTTANSYADVVSAQGLLQFGHSKDDPDRPQLKIALAILDPLGLPLATAVVPGNCADDPLYVPAIRSVQQSLGLGGRTYVGDCKMATLAIVTREGVEGLLGYEIRAVMTTQKTRGYRGRPAREETDVSFEIEVTRDATRIEDKKRALGWQVYGTNGLVMTLPQVVRAYRGPYRIENDWSRLKGRPLGLTPLYLQDENRIQGLVYLLSLALRVLTLVEWVVREGLRKEGAQMQSVYAGQPGRKTARPSAELLLEAMKTIRVSVVDVNGHTYALLSPLTEVQQRLLQLWELPPDLYEKVTRGFPEPPPKTSEP